MNRLIIASLALLASSAMAGVKIETITRDINTQVAKGATTVIQVQDGAVRTTTTDGALILRGGVMTFIDDKRKSYSEMDKATMDGHAKRANAAMSQMQERLKNMTPEQRAQMEKMMGGMAMPGAGGKTPVFDAKNTGKTDTVEGRKCTTWHLLQDGKVIDEMCVVPFSSLPGKEDMQKSFKELAETFAGIANAVPGAKEQAKVRNSIDGYPVRSRAYVNGKPQGIESVLKSWTETTIPASAFTVPAGYKKKDLPMGAAP
jgi:hypothetical protein